VTLLYYVVGMAIAAMAGGALGQSLVEERGRKILPVVVALTLAMGLIIGWALDGTMQNLYASPPAP
jgi:uncharacterized protein YcfJ